MWLAGCLFLNVSLGAGIYGSQFFLVLLFAVWLVQSLRQDSVRVFWLTLLLVALATWVFAAGGLGLRVWPELSKVMFILLASFVLRDLLPEEGTGFVTLAVPILVASLVVLAFLQGTWDYYDPVLHRFGVSALGSPNTTAYVLSFCLLFLHYRFRLGLGQWERRVHYAAFVILAAGLAGTQSRGGLLVYLTGLFVLSGRRLRVVMLGATLATAGLMLFSGWAEEVSRLNVLIDIRETGGSSRLVIWRVLLDNLLKHPFALVVGMGPGAISLYTDMSETPILSAHSTFVEVVYSYGLLGLALLLYALSRLRRAVAATRGASNCYALKRGLFVGFVVSLLSDSYPLTAQILWFTPLLIALLLLPQARDRADHAQA